MRNSRHILLMTIFLLLIQMTTSRCERRPLEEMMPTSVTLPVTIHWEEAGIIPQNVTMLIYDIEGRLWREHVFENQGETVKTTLSLPTGQYSVVVINELRDQIDYLHIRGHEHLSTLEAYIIKATTLYDTKGRADGDEIVNQPGELATLVTSIHISPEMLMEFNSGAITSKSLQEEYQQLNNLRPLLRTVNAEVRVEVKGLHNALMPALAELRNLAGGYLIGQDQNSMTPVTTQFTLNNRQYAQGSVTDGEISGEISCLGLLGNRTSTDDSELTGIYLNVWFQLVDEAHTRVGFEWNITDQIMINTHEQLLSLKLELTTPEPLPDVQPEGSDKSGFSSELVEWETEDVLIELQ